MTFFAIGPPELLSCTPGNQDNQSQRWNQTETKPTNQRVANGNQEHQSLRAILVNNPQILLYLGLFWVVYSILF